MVRIYNSLMLSLMAIVGWTTAVWAIELETKARFEVLEQEVAELKWQSQGATDDFSIDHSQATFEGGAELTLLSPQIGSLVLRDVIQDRFKVTPDYDLEAAFRVWIGRHWSNGLGWRVAYWKFDDMVELDFSEQIKDTALSSALDLYAVDIELTRQGRICNWDIFSSIGVRIGGIGTEEAFRMGDSVASFNQQYTGGGLTFSIGTQQPLGHGNWSVYGGFRGSLLYGVTNFNISASIDQLIHFDGNLKGSVVGQTVSVMELQLGLQYERPTRFGLLFGRAGVETQLWELPPSVAGLGDKNVGLLGPTFFVGLRR